MNIKEYVYDTGKKAKEASHLMVKTSSLKKNRALEEIASALEAGRSGIISENKKDIEAGRKKGLSDAFIDRLILNNERIDGMIKVLSDVKGLKDPVGEITGMSVIENGLKVGKMR
ncbi:MAG: gamma-glutamyl-phosphate reductase, partial [bacterium]